MKHIRFWLAAVAVLLGSISVNAHDFESDGIYYNLISSTDFTVAVTFRGSNFNDYSNEYTGAVSIPEAVTYNSNSYRVTSIGSRAFCGCSSLTSITIPEGVTSIREFAFGGCSSLSSITIPKGVTSISEGALSGCSSLTSITIPENITSIGMRAFDGCTSLKEVIIEDGNTTLSLGYHYHGNGNYGLFYECPLNRVYLGRNLSYSSGYSPFYKGKS